MVKQASIFICQNCESSYPRWQGQCQACGEWNTLVETVSVKSPGKSGAGKSRRASSLVQETVKLSEVEHTKGAKRRFSTGIGELDRVLGMSGQSDAGLVPGSVILMGGEPGIGKSTLLTQVAINWLLPTNQQSLPSSTPSSTPQPFKPSILYICGEESPSQIGLRIKRILDSDHYKNVLKKLGDHDEVTDTLEENLIFVTTTDVDKVTELIDQAKPSLVIVDSIQTLFTQELSGASGSVGQIRESAERIITQIKALGIPTFLIGHVTKEGNIAGPKILEHMVDAVLELSGERTGQLRLMRAIKNRFGATDEVGVFQVVDWGMSEVSNPTDLFLEHLDKPVSGSAKVCIMEGTRPLLVEVQALVVKSALAMPRRVGRGVELSRIQVLSAVLQKHAKLPLGTYDVFLSVAGGFKIQEPAADLGLAVAIASSLKNQPVPNQTVFVGEVGLLGEIRSVSYLERRIKEAKRLGFTPVVSRASHQNVRQVLAELKLI